jgi:hypothetical protein
MLNNPFSAQDNTMAADSHLLAEAMANFVSCVTFRAPR